MATLKQKRAIAKSLENGGNISKAMRESGYSAAMAKNPQKLTESVAYKSLAERIPDDLLEKTHIEGLQAKSFRYSPEGELIQTDDFAIRHKYLDSAYKLKGSYAAEKHVNVNLEVSKEERDKIFGIATGVIEKMTSEEIAS